MIRAVFKGSPLKLSSTVYLSPAKFIKEKEIHTKDYSDSILNFVCTHEFLS